MKPIVNLYKLGLVSYAKALNIQQTLFEQSKKTVQLIGRDVEAPIDQSVTRNSLLLLEHDPVYTIGIRNKQYNENYVDKLKQTLDEHNMRADFVRTNRGGLITFHGPGQLVAYPIIYLGDFTRTNKSVKTYVNLLESTIISALDAVGLPGAHTLQEHPGVWLGGGERKIAFIGISCKRYVTMHGVSINCDCDLAWFDHIVSCGIEDKIITSVSRELFAGGSDARVTESKTSQCARDQPEQTDRIEYKNLASISEAFCASFARHFDCKLIEKNYKLIST